MGSQLGNCRGFPHARGPDERRDDGLARWSPQGATRRGALHYQVSNMLLHRRRITQFLRLQAVLGLLDQMSSQRLIHATGEEALVGGHECRGKQRHGAVLLLAHELFDHAFHHGEFPLEAVQIDRWRQAFLQRQLL